MNKVFHDVNGEPHEYDGLTNIAWRVSGYALIKKDKKFLFIKQPYSTKLELPGGGLFPQEELKTGIERECLEETGLRVNVESNKLINYQSSNFFNVDEPPFFFHSIALFLKGEIESMHSEQSENVDIYWLSDTEITEAKVQAMHLNAYRSTKDNQLGCQPKHTIM